MMPTPKAEPVSLKNIFFVETTISEGNYFSWEILEIVNFPISRSYNFWTKEKKEWKNFEN